MVMVFGINNCVSIINWEDVTRSQWDNFDDADVDDDDDYDVNDDDGDDNDDDIDDTPDQIRVTLIVPACQPGWEEMENLRGNG